jgi:hypothetical protein
MLTVVDGVFCRLECEVVTQPAPTVQWLFNGAVLNPSKKHAIYPMGNKKVLEVRDVTANDAGVYVCRIFNELGEAATSTVLHVTSWLKTISLSCLFIEPMC